MAALGEGDFVRLLADPGIVRNRLKVAAVIDNARFTSHPATRAALVTYARKLTFQSMLR